MANNRLVIATDGYWADFDIAKQSGFLGKRFMTTMAVRNDVSCLVLSSTSSYGVDVTKHDGEENFVIVRGW